ncbi:energy-coupling factor transporter transmembrane protein EcfT [Agromyces endophyticus]|nr:energy-coupling factor transporter transmembrane component T [Agromyces sp. H17E-10]UOQ91304.1 energy-coupling factor transporter transmembrane protein EcfT [Agromyces sp. H17E-10]
MNSFRLDVPHANPVARLLAALAIAIALVFSVDWVSALTALVLESLLFLQSEVPVVRIVRRSLPIVVAALLTGLTILLYGQPSGRVHVEALLVTVSDGSIELAAATVLRVLAIGLPSVLFFTDMDPTDLADGLAQILRLPSRFVIGALAGFRLVGLLRHDWAYLGYARRARGVADHGRVRRTAGQAFALLVFAVRRGAKLATAMEARGFGAHATRTWARPSVMRGSDYVLIALCLAIGLVSVAFAVSTGAWNFIGAH